MDPKHDAKHSNDDIHLSDFKKVDTRKKKKKNQLPVMQMMVFLQPDRDEVQDISSE